MKIHKFPLAFAGIRLQPSRCSVLSPTTEAQATGYLPKYSLIAILIK
jgi:hypothetical protein